MRFKTQIMVLVMATMLGLWLTACHFDWFEEWGSKIEKEDSPAAASTAESETVPEPPFAAGRMVGAFNPNLAMEWMYGNYDAITQRARWQPSGEELARFGFKPSVEEVYSSILLAAPYREDSTEKYLVLTRTWPQTNACRGCVPVLGGAVYQLDNDAADWTQVSESKFITRLKGADRWSARVLRIGSNSNGALLHWRRDNAGMLEEGDLLIGLREGRLRPLLSVITGRSNKAVCDNNDSTKPLCWEYVSRLSFQRGIQTLYDDLLVTRQGTMLSEDGSEIISASQTQRFTYVKGKYVLQGTQANRIRPRP